MNTKDPLSIALLMNITKNDMLDNTKHGEHMPKTKHTINKECNG